MGDVDVSNITTTVAGNRLIVLEDGPERLDALITLIDGAERSLRLLYYIFLDDGAGTRVRDALLRALDRGVTVSLLIDGFGSDSAKASFFEPLTQAGAGFCRFSARFGRRYLLRNHQKLALADERRVIFGGFNVADEYFGTARDNAWRDLGLQVEGDSVSCLADYFDQLFRWTLRPDGRIRDLRSLLRQHSITDGELHWLFGGPTRRLSPWARALRRDALSATRIDIIAAYFAPSIGMLRRIAAIARRGRARIVTAAKSDNSMTVLAARNTYWWLLKRGVEVFEYQPTKLHTKLFIVDDIVHVGSANFDMRSMFLNLEMMLRIDDAGFAAAMRRFVDAEIGDSREVTLANHAGQRTMLNRLKWGISYFFVAIADYRISHLLNFGAERPAA